MLKLFVFDEKELSVLDPAQAEQKGIQADFQKESVRIQFAGYDFTLQPEEPVFVAGHIFVLRGLKNLTLVPLGKEYLFGRQPGMSQMVSARHFLMKKEKQIWTIEDQSSTYGTYINGTRKQIAGLVSGDWIFAGGILFLYLDDLLVVFEAIEAPTIRSCPSQSDSPVPMMIESSPMVLSLQMPKDEGVAVKSHWFLSAGSSLMILASSLCVFGLQAAGGSDLSVLLPSLAQSGAMAGGFLLFGLLSRRIQSHQSRQNQESERRAYRLYLAQMKNQAMEEVFRRRQVFAQMEEAIAAFPEAWKKTSPFPGIPCGSNEQNAISFQTSQIAYHQKGQPGIEALEELRDMSFPAPELCFFSEEDWVTVEAGDDLIPLLAGLLFYAKDPKTKIGCVLSRHDIPDWHSAFEHQGQSTCFEDQKKAMAFVRSHSEIPWILLLDELPDPAWNTLDLSTPARICLDPACRFPKVSPPFLRSDGRRALAACHQPDLTGDPGSFEPGLLKDLTALDLRKKQANLTVYLAPEIDLDFGKEGPHSLIAGTTGSGKSEALFLILLQLALYNRPDQVSFFLVDFKGGALSTLFERTPHLAGTVTNLSETAIRRARTALEIEIEDRQKRMAAFQMENPAAIPDADSYNLVHPDKPISHLFLVVDEFAELKSRYPEFMAYIQQMARIGRSLGIHLILTTQKPAGVVDGQTWSNTAIKLCFKVQDKADSLEVLGCSGAEHLEGPGSFCLLTPQKQSEGQAFYARAPLRPESGVFDPAQYSKTIAGRIFELVETDGKHDWLLHPDFDQCQTSGLVQDYVRFLKPASITPGQTWSLYCPTSCMDETARRLLSAWDLPSACLGIPLLEKDLEENRLWPLYECEKPVLLVVNLDQPVSEAVLDGLEGNSNLCLIYLFSRIDPGCRKRIMKSPVHLCCKGVDLMEAMSLFSKRPDPEPWPVLCGEDEQGNQLRLCLKERKSGKENLEIQPGYCARLGQSDLSLLPEEALIGFDARTHVPLFAPSENRLILAGKSSVNEEQIEQYRTIWRTQNPAQPLKPLLMDPVLNRADLLQAIENRELLVVLDDGANGLLFQAGIHAASIPAGFGLLVQGNETLLIELPSVQEEPD